MPRHCYVYYRIDAALLGSAVTEARAWLQQARALGACRQARLLQRHEARVPPDAAQAEAGGSVTLMEVYDYVDEQRFGSLPLQTMGMTLAKLKRTQEWFDDLPEA